MRRHIALALLPCLAACATPADRYPSLAIRDVERAQGRFEPTVQPPLPLPELATADGAPVTERLAALRVAATAAHNAFLDRAASATRTIGAAAGAPQASVAWANAEVALADLESARSTTAIALGDLDALMVATAIQAQDVSAIEAVRQAVIAQVAAEDATLATLRARLR